MPLGNALRIALLFAALWAGAWPSAADDIDKLPLSAIFVSSGGYWSDPGELPSPTVTGTTPGGSPAPAGPARHGYYKLVAIRQPDRSAKVYLQQIAVSQAGLELINSVELEELTMLHPYVTDIRPEDSTGISRQPGLLATVYLKTDPGAFEPESWTVLIDEFGDITVSKAGN